PDPRRIPRDRPRSGAPGRREKTNPTILYPKSPKELYQVISPERTNPIVSVSAAVGPDRAPRGAVTKRTQRRANRDNISTFTKFGANTNGPEPMRHGGHAARPEIAPVMDSIGAGTRE